MPMVFLSHSSKDNSLAQRVGIDLRMSGIDVWLDEWEMKVGDSISQKIQRGLESANYIVVTLSKASVESGWVEKEWQGRIWEEASTRNVVILPAIAEECRIPLLLRDKHYADLRRDYEGEIRKLIGSIRSHFYGGGYGVGAGARIESGKIYYNTVNPNIPELLDMITVISGGYFERQENRLRVHIETMTTRKSIQQLQERLGLNRLVLDSPDFTISADPIHPSVFKGEKLFSIPSSELLKISFPRVSPRVLNLRPSIEGVMTTAARATVEGGKIRGAFGQVYTYDMGEFKLRIDVNGEFETTIALRS